MAKGQEKLFDTTVKPEAAVLVGIILPHDSEEKEQEYLEELAFLVETAGGIPQKTFTQKLQHPDKATFVGSGKLEEIKEYVKAEEIDLVVFDDE